jgi:hypothetical protein
MIVELGGVQMVLLIRIPEERGARLGRVIGCPHKCFFLSSHFLPVSLKSFRVADVGTDSTFPLCINFTFCQEVNSDEGENKHRFSTARFLSR